MNDPLERSHTIGDNPNVGVTKSASQAARLNLELSKNIERDMSSNESPQHSVTGVHATSETEALDRTRQLQTELAHADRLMAIGKMASTLAHEINQPLASIANYAQACSRQLQSGQGVTPEVIEALQRIAAEALRAGEIVRRLRQFAGKTAGRRAPANLNALVYEVHEFLQPEARRAGVTMRIKLLDGLPEVIADPVQIQQVLVNLLRNAIEAASMPASSESQPGTPDTLVNTEPVGTRTVDLETAATPYAVVVRVCDSGPAVTSETIAQMFEPYFTTKPQGLGLGLSISQSLIEAHGGRLTATAQPQGGLCLEFELPLAPQSGV